MNKIRKEVGENIRFKNAISVLKQCENISKKEIINFGSCLEGEWEGEKNFHKHTTKAADSDEMKRRFVVPERRKKRAKHETYHPKDIFTLHKVSFMHVSSGCKLDSTIAERKGDRK